MRKEEFVTEYDQGADTDEIFRQLEQAGYQYLGGGQDATVWGKDEGEVLKVLMPSPSKESAEQSFMLFHDACQAMQGNPHVPHFVDIFSVFEINGTDYVQITMERLQPISEGAVDQALVWALAELCATDNVSWSDVISQMKDFNFWISYPGDIDADDPDTFMDNILHAVDKSVHKYEKLFNTMKAFYEIARSNGLGWDLHTENVMQRADGTLVITDPFYN